MTTPSTSPSQTPLSQTPSRIVPLLVVRGAVRAIDFYVRALGARVLGRHEHGDERHISHADLALDGATWSLTEEARAWNSDAPESLGGSPVVLQLRVQDAAATCGAMQAAGASVLFPVQELLGERMARLRDPFGHIWLLRQPLRELSVDEIQNQRDELYALYERALCQDGAARTRHERTETLPQSAPAEQGPGAGIHLVLGPVGAGKSTFAQRLACQHGAVRLTLDEWMVVLFRPDRPDTGLVEWYGERAARCVEQIWRVTQELLAAGTSAVLEIGLLQRAARQSFYQRVEAAGASLELHVLDAPREVRRARVLERNRQGGPTFSMVVPLEVFELASDLWEPLGAEECEGRAVCFVDTLGHAGDPGVSGENAAAAQQGSAKRHGA